MTDILRSVADVRAFQQVLGKKTLALVPTMGNLHDGHLSLIRLAQSHCSAVMVSIFVNPTQFAPNEDLDSYPRTFAKDMDKLQTAGVDAVFYPEISTLYPLGSENTIRIEMPAAMTQILCGLSRPTHFQGVATVVTKLLQIIRPNVAVFGEKDFQQLAIIRRLVSELFIETEVVGGKIIREANGLAMSSRNQYLSADQRLLAGQLSKTLQESRQRLLAGDMPDSVLTEAKQRLTTMGIEVEYLDFRDSLTLESTPIIDSGILLIAARLGKTRLIDNLRIVEA